MKKFIIRIIYFALLFITLFCVIASLNYYFVKSEKLIATDYKNILILGDSNTECAINDSIFKKGINKSASSDSYFYSYLKLKAIVNSSSVVDTVLLAFAPHNLFDNGWLLNDNHIYSRFQNYYPLMDWEDCTFLLKNNPRAFFSSLSGIISRTSRNIVKKMLRKKIISSYGGFQNLDRNILKEEQLRLNRGLPLPFFKIPSSFEVSSGEELYLDKVISLCKKNKLKLYFINTPKRVELLKYPKYGVEEFNKFYDIKYKNVDFLDFSNLELPDDNYGDFVHLNRKGSTNFSSLLEREGLKNLIENFNTKLQMHRTYIQ